MLRTSPLRPSWLLTAILAAGCLATYAAAPAQTAAPAAAQAEKVSSFGKYSGYSEPVYDGWTHSSRYVTVRDGTRLAVDVFRPTRNGKVAEERLPVVWTHHRYRCTVVDEGKTYTIVDTFEWLQPSLEGSASSPQGILRSLQEAPVP